MDIRNPDSEVFPATGDLLVGCACVGLRLRCCQGLAVQIAPGDPVAGGSPGVLLRIVICRGDVVKPAPWHNKHAFLRVSCLPNAADAKPLLLGGLRLVRFDNVGIARGHKLDDHDHVGCSGRCWHTEAQCPALAHPQLRAWQACSAWRVACARPQHSGRTGRVCRGSACSGEQPTSGPAGSGRLLQARLAASLPGALHSAAGALCFTAEHHELGAARAGAQRVCATVLGCVAATRQHGSRDCHAALCCVVTACCAGDEPRRNQSNRRQGKHLLPGAHGG